MFIVFLRELALSNTRFAMGANIVLEVMRGLSVLSVKCMHSIIAWTCIREHPLWLFALWYCLVFQDDKIHLSEWVTFCTKIRKVSSSFLVCGGWTFWWDNVKSTKQSILATTTGQPALYLDPDCLWTSPPCPPRPPLGVTRIQILPQICMSDVWELEWQWWR